jgi:hypothetical protein
MKQWVIIALVALAALLLWKFGFPHANVYQVVQNYPNGCPAGWVSSGISDWSGSTPLYSCHQYFPCTAVGDCAGLPGQCSSGLTTQWKCEPGANLPGVCQYDCVASETPVPVVTKPSSVGDWILMKLRSFIDGLLKLLGIGASVTGSSASVVPGGSATFNINMVVANPDSDYTDGTYQAQYGGWALYDSNYNIVAQASNWKQIQGTYTDVVTVTMPQTTGKYAFTAVVIQYNMNYLNNAWAQSDAQLLAKDGVSISVGAPAPSVVTTPVGNWFTNFLATIINFIKSLFGG